VTLGIVGHEEAKFTQQTRARAQIAIVGLIEKYNPDLVVSGACPLGGVDIWAEEEAKRLGVPFKAYAPTVHQWSGRGGFKERNLEIAKSDVVACVSVVAYPSTYRGRRFKGCYHCNGRNPQHVKGGGCWTAWKAKAREFVFI